jgi:integrase
MNDFSAEWRWSPRAADYAPRTIKDQTGFASAFVAWLDHEGIALDKATRGDAERWLVSLASVHQRRRAVYALKAFARWCAEENISDDFGIRLRAPKCPSPPQKVASGEEVEALLAACRGRGFEVARDAALIATFASTGMRRSEMKRVEVEHLDLDAGTILLPTSKNKRGRLAFPGRRRPHEARALSPLPLQLPARRRPAPVGGAQGSAERRWDASGVGEAWAVGGCSGALARVPARVRRRTCRRAPSPSRPARSPSPT